MNSTVVMMIVGMAAVTYIPRMLPFIVFKGKELSPFWQGVLKNVPFAVLGALIFPKIFLIKEDDLLFGVIGTIAAFLFAYSGANVIVVVLGAIGVLSVYSVVVL